MISIVMAALFSLSGCVSTASFYCPNTINVPLLREQNEAHITGSIGIGDGEYGCSSNMYDVNASYAITDHLGIMGSAHGFSSVDDNGINNSLTNSSTMGDIGVGYYKTLDAKKRLITEVYGGMGFGTLNTTGLVTGNMQMYRLFVQPSIGLRTAVFDFVFSVRACDVNYHYNSSPAVYAALLNAKEYEVAPANGSNNLFIEPAITMRLGYKFVKLQWQLMASLGKGSFRYDSFVTGLGLNFNLEYLYPERKNEENN